LPGNGKNKVSNAEQTTGSARESQEDT